MDSLRLKHIFCLLGILVLCQPPTSWADTKDEVRVRPREASVEDARCPFCHDEFRPKLRDVSLCDGCHTLMDVECFKEHGKCATLGCTSQAATLLTPEEKVSQIQVFADSMANAAQTSREVTIAGLGNEVGVLLARVMTLHAELQKSPGLSEELRRTEVSLGLKVREYENRFAFPGREYLKVLGITGLVTAAIPVLGWDFVAQYETFARTLVLTTLLPGATWGTVFGLLGLNIAADTQSRGGPERTLRPFLDAVEKAAKSRGVILSDNREYAAVGVREFGENEYEVRFNMIRRLGARIVDGPLCIAGKVAEARSK